MKKYLYKNPKLRCKVLYSNGIIILTLQKRFWRFFWLESPNCVIVEEAKTEFEPSPICYLISMGGVREIYSYGTLDVQKRVNQMFRRYNQMCREEKQKIRRLNELLDR